MAVGSGALPELHPVAGVKIAIGSAGIKKPGRKDLVLFELAEGSTTAAVFTQNRFCAAPVQVAREHLKSGSPRYLLINTGNANAGTGQRGMQAARRSCEAVAELTGCKASEVLPFSTGVIGETLPLAKIEAALPTLPASLNEGLWLDAAHGIMTTDTRPKAWSAKVEGTPYTVTGISKGAGMIKPNMATMLGFAATDAPVSADVLQSLLSDIAERSFNRITVDGDTSTNDACVLVATGKAGGELIDSSDAPHYQALQAALLELFTVLAQAIVRDGEGATKFVAVKVEGGANRAECLKAAFTVAESPLVKTALFASDPNWGRILAALGRAGIDDLDVEKVTVSINGVVVAEAGGLAESYTEAAGQAAMAPEELTICIYLDRGDASETVWTTDFSHDYVTINASYRS
ncbi:glutamate N-acetyltransferase/amino-acid N-acetyltransferase [Litorivivens lipolytica]|uniref:Arginine biosynthesis bifunctional protein ArgJ n=1 Tax=Litorivivens lipolytica TaxID=1524264 RepID=A0A7W4W546_9GAMM|nr:bifunctional glutamate N-acetyltransferase/amino-acid acetyltransferase ArgJ [Litorivivens lipolytica]MBB3047069.1 glutamate N-acetyltransferase/amino-acid N-acetyltransferase [Litorivivens lipolytica]